MHTYTCQFCPRRALQHKACNNLRSSTIRQCPIHRGLHTASLSLAGFCRDPQLSFVGGSRPFRLSSGIDWALASGLGSYQQNTLTCWRGLIQKSEIKCLEITSHALPGNFTAKASESAWFLDPGSRRSEYKYHPCVHHARLELLCLAANVLFVRDP